MPTTTTSIMTRLTNPFTSKSSFPDPSVDPTFIPHTPAGSAVVPTAVPNHKSIYGVFGGIAFVVVVVVVVVIVIVFGVGVVSVIRGAVGGGDFMIGGALVAAPLYSMLC